MFKVVWGGRFSDGLTPDEGRRRWTNELAPLGLKNPGLRGYVQNYLVAGLTEGEVVDIDLFLDGYSCEYWDSEEAFVLSTKTPAWQAVLKAGEDVFDSSSFEGASAALQERVIKDGPLLPFKVVWFARFLSGLDRDEASAHWLDIHANIAIEAPDIGRYVQNLVVGSIGANGITDEQVVFDGFSECWFANRDSYERTVSSEPWVRLNEDAETLFEMTAMDNGMSALLEEHVILDPRQPVPS